MDVPTTLTGGELQGQNDISAIIGEISANDSLAIILTNVVDASIHPPATK